MRGACLDLRWIVPFFFCGYFFRHFFSLFFTNKIDPPKGYKKDVWDDVRIPIFFFFSMIFFPSELVQDIAEKCLAYVVSCVFLNQKGGGERGGNKWLNDNLKKKTAKSNTVSASSVTTDQQTSLSPLTLTFQPFMSLMRRDNNQQTKEKEK